MIKVKIIEYGKPNLSDAHPWNTMGQNLEDFINQVGYENIKQILVNGQSNSPRFTVIYEE